MASYRNVLYPSIEQKEHRIMANQTTPLQNLTYVETVLKDVQAVLKTMHEDQTVPFEQQGKLSGCLDEIWHALGTIQDGETGLRGKLKRLEAIEKRVEPPVTGTWTRYRGSLLQCLEKAADTYNYTTQENQGDHDWRVWALQLKQRDKDIFTPQELRERIAHEPDQTALPAILDYDTSWLGKSLYREDQVEPLWVHAKLYIVGDNEPVALIYRIDFEDEEEEPVDLVVEQHNRIESPGYNQLGEDEPYYSEPDTESED